LLNLESNKLDMTDPNRNFEILLDAAQDQPAYEPLLSLLQHLLLVRRVDPVVFAKYLRLIDEAVAQIVLDGKGENCLNEATAECWLE